MQKEKRGRKPIKESLKKIAVQLYVERHKIEKLGGIETTKDILINYIENKTKKR